MTATFKSHGLGFHVIMSMADAQGIRGRDCLGETTGGAHGREVAANGWGLGCHRRVDCPRSLGGWGMY